VNVYLHRFSLHKIEVELGTEIKPIPKVINKELYVAEFQLEGHEYGEEEEEREARNQSGVNGVAEDRQAVVAVASAKPPAVGAAAGTAGARRL